jgi:serine/threonine protein kinase
MTIHTTGSLIDTLRTFRLISAEQYKELFTQIHSKGGDPRPLAKQLVQRGWLTVYQINQLFAGRGKELVVGAYRVVDRLGQGGLSNVYKARHVELDHVVALKVIRPEVLANPEGRRQFLQEVDAMTRLDHPNIVQFCDADHHDDTCYFAMEYIDGIDLGKHVKLSGPLSVRRASEYIRQAATGLQHAHERNLVHRDIKPGNLFVSVARRSSSAHKGRGAAARYAHHRITILDWGLAALRSSRTIDEVPAIDDLAKGLMGTADYLSPEQARNASAVDIRGDIYSLGCSLYYLLTGQPPFPSGTLMQKILQHQEAQPKPIESFRGDVPAGFSAVLDRLLAKNAEERYQTPAAAALALLPFARMATTKASAQSSAALKTSLPTKAKDHTPLPARLAGQPERKPTASDTACA